MIYFDVMENKNKYKEIFLNWLVFKYEEEKKINLKF